MGASESKGPEYEAQAQAVAELCRMAGAEGAPRPSGDVTCPLAGLRHTWAALPGCNHRAGRLRTRTGARCRMAIARGQALIATPAPWSWIS